MKAFENPKIRPNHNDSGYLIDLENIFVHENYNNFQTINDIALIYIEEGLEQNLIKLPRSHLNLTGKLAKIGGFGLTNDKEVKKDHFEFVELPIVKSEECQKVYQNPFGGNQQLCLKTSNKMSTCR